MSHVHRNAFKMAERLVVEMEKTFEITIKDTDCAFPKMYSNLVILLIHPQYEFTDEVIQELIDPTEGPVRQRINEWGPHMVWLCQALDVLYKRNSGE